MARTVDQILRAQLGDLMLEVAILTSQKEALGEENLKLRDELKSVREPDNKTKEGK